MLEFLQENWEFIFALIPLLLSLGANLFGGLQKIISHLMLFAEKKANEAFQNNGLITGEEKKEFVVNYVFEKMPKFLHPFITKAYIGKKVENIISDLKDIKDDGVLNASSGE